MYSSRRPRTLLHAKNALISLSLDLGKGVLSKKSRHLVWCLCVYFSSKLETSSWDHSIYTWIASMPRRHIHPWRFDCDGLSMAVRSWRCLWRLDLSLAVCRLTLHPWRLIRVVQNAFHTDRSCNHPRRCLIGVRSMSMTAHPGQYVHNTSFMTT